MTELLELEPWRETRLRCSIGHVYRGRVHRVRHQAHDMDGEPLWLPPSEDFDPDTCVVCGLKTWSEDQDSAPTHTKW